MSSGKPKYNYINVMRLSGMPLETVGTLQQLLNGIAQFGEDGFSDFEAIKSKAERQHVPLDVAYRFQDCVDLRSPFTALQVGGHFTIEIAGVWTALLSLAAVAEAVILSKPEPAPQYGVVHDVLKGEWQGPKSIVCREGGDWREVCTFNRGGGIWGERERVEMDVVLKALRSAA